jgi:16S rRNA (cytosine967-C5)-methyltransferase
MTLASAARAVAQVAAHGRSSDDALAAYADSAQRGAIQAVTLGTLRWYLRLAPALAPLVETRQRPLAAEIHALLVVAAHQVVYSRNAPQAIVHAAVDAARALEQPRASGLVNAVLRRFVAERAALLALADRNPAAAAAHPEWLMREIERAWPAERDAVLQSNNLHPPLTLRVDLSRVPRDAYLAELARAGCPGRALGWAAAAVELEHPIAVADIPGFSQGRVSVQDGGAQLAAPLLGAGPGMRVLDACAAPGGKTLHLLEQSPGIAELVAVDVDPVRLRRVEDNLARAGRAARLVAGDLRGAGAAALGGPFQRILVDAPCSGTGVIRRHPDIKLLRRVDDVAGFAAAQLKILEGAFRLLAPGGRLLYCTCSVLPAENDELVTAFLEREPLAKAASMPRAPEVAPGARARSVGVQLLPGDEAGADGFYYACLEKTTAGN